MDNIFAFQAEFSDLIALRQIRLVTNIDEMFERLSTSYPIGLNRIDWRGFKSCKMIEVMPIDMSPIDEERHLLALSRCKPHIADWFTGAFIQPVDEVIWFGDSMDVAATMTTKVFLEYFPKLLYWPQHHYVLPLVRGWCMNYTLEKQLYFGLDNDVLQSGLVDYDDIEADL